MKKIDIEETGAGPRDYTAVAGIGIAIAAVIGGFALEHGRIGDLASLNSLVIVAGGTLGAILIGTPRAILKNALERCRHALRAKEDDRRATADRIVEYATLVRRAGSGSIEAEAEAMEPGFLRRALLLIVDGVSAPEVRQQLGAEISAEHEKEEAAACVFEQAGGYAPTIGIIGAVVGLIQVMKQLGNVDAVGHGIAAAFVSTLYGVALANLVLLPLAARIRTRAVEESRSRELILEGVTAIAEGVGLRVVRSRLETYAGPKEAGAELRAVSGAAGPALARRSA